MKHFPIAVLLPLLISLLLMTGCKKAVPQAESAEYAPSTERSVPEQSTPGLSPGIPCQAPELTEAGFFVSLYHYDRQMQRNDLWQWSYRFEDVRPIEYDMYAPPVRFDGDKSLWMTYSRDGDSDNCIMGRCICTQAEWDFMDRVLLSADYQTDPEYTVPYGTPVFILRQGTDCTERTTRIPPGRTGYIDDELCRYYVSPDGSVLKGDADGSVSRSVTPLAPETVARLYLIYETYYRAWTRQVVCPYDLTQPGAELVLLVRTADRELSVPKEKWDAFLSLVSVEEDKEGSPALPCFKVVQQLFASEEYPADEVLRFRFFTVSDDPDSGTWRWCSVREDGKIILESPWGGGILYSIANWSVISPVRYISKASFDVDAITALVFGE